MVDIPAAYAPDLRIGTCSWKYDSWKGLYYDETRRYRPNDYLKDYAQHLDSVEVDQWFWSLFPGGLRLPEPKTVQIYADSVPDNFVFTIKAPNALTLTHYYARQPKHHIEFAGRPNIYFCDLNLLNRFLELVEPLGAKLGPIMFQYEFLNRAKMSSLEEFLDMLDPFFSKAPAGFEYAIETRNPNFLDGPFFDFLGRHSVDYVYIDGYRMPPIGEVFEEHQPAAGRSAVVRLHGDNRSAIEKETNEIWNRIVAPKDDGLRSAARIVRANKEKAMRTFVNVNNHYEGSAPLTIRRFLDVLIEGEEAGEGEGHEKGQEKNDEEGGR